MSGCSAATTFNAHSGTLGRRSFATIAAASRSFAAFSSLTAASRAATNSSGASV